MVAVHFPEEFAAEDFSGPLAGIAEALSGAAFAQAVSAVGFTAVAVPSEVDSMAAASVAAPTGATIAEVNTQGVATARRPPQRGPVEPTIGTNCSKLATAWSPHLVEKPWKTMD